MIRSRGSNLNKKTKMVMITMWVDQDLLRQINRVVFDEVRSTSATARKLIRIGLNHYKDE